MIESDIDMFAEVQLDEWKRWVSRGWEFSTWCGKDVIICKTVGRKTKPPYLTIYLRIKPNGSCRVWVRVVT